jgi:hypothetical protein
VNILQGIVNLFRFDKTNWKAVTLCLVAATVFWFFNALNKEHTATISFPIEFQYDQAGFVPVKRLPENVRLNITGSGWDLLRKSLGFKVVPLSVPLDHPTEILKIPPANVLSLAAAQMGQTRVNHVASDTLILSIEPRKSKKVKLAVNQNQLRFELGFGRSSPIVILPDSVLVEGPSSILMKMPDSILLPFSSGRVSHNVKEELEITQPEGATIQITPHAASVMFEVSELIDVRRKLKVLVIPSPPFRSQASMDSISVTIRLPIKLGDDLVKKIATFAVIDLRALDTGVSTVAPSVKGISPFAEVVSMDSVTIRKY